MENTSTSEPIYLVPIQWDWRPVIQLILAIIGIIGNSIVIHVYLRSRKLIKSSTNTLIAALAIADLITSICIIPHPLLSRVPNTTAGHFYCKVVYSSNIMWVSIVASIFTLTAVSVERFVAIRYPSRYRSLLSLKVTRIIIVSIWLAAFIINTFSYYVTHLHQGQCIVEFPSMGFQIFLGTSLFLIEYLIPMIIMLIANVRTIQILQEQGRNLSGERGSPKSLATVSVLRARRRVIIMLLIVIVSFVICWSPDQFAFLVFNWGLVPFRYLFGNLYRFFVVLAFANSCVNPIIYLFVNKNFREAIRQQLPSSLRSSRKYKENTLFEVPFDDSATKVSNAASQSHSDIDMKEMEKGH
ncbi:galanin receptor 2b-like [Amphiura filiformis]|uniref:galanin receptor 2b-like n=1 Tax=Amphiura filiformis TaxID=82378 RepID=UPI003B21349E